MVVLEHENKSLGEKIQKTDLLMSALTSLQEKNTHLENNLSAETRIKLDLFSALGEAKRQLEIRDSKFIKLFPDFKNKCSYVLPVFNRVYLQKQLT